MRIIILVTGLALALENKNYSTIMGDFFQEDSFGPDSPFHVFENRGLGVNIIQLPFDEVMPKQAVCFLQGIDWARGKFKAIYIVDRVRLVLGGRREVDLTLWLNPGDDEDMDYITVSSSDIYWYVLVLNEEGVEKITRFSAEFWGMGRFDQFCSRPLPKWE